MTCSSGAILKKEVEACGGWVMERIPTGLEGAIEVVEAELEPEPDPEADPEPEPEPDAEPETEPEAEAELETEEEVGIIAREKREESAVDDAMLLRGW